MLENKDIYFIENGNDINLYLNYKRKKYNIPEELLGIPIKKIGERMFINATSIVQEVTLPNTIDEIKYRAFNNCKNLTSINIPQNVKAIQSKAFANTGLEELILPENMDRLGSCTFADCKNLKKVIMPKNLFEFGSGMFCDNVSLENVKLSKNINEIPRETFYGCTKLKEIYLPKNITKIRNEAFSKCLMLEQIHCEQSLDEIELKAFSDCPNLQMIKLAENAVISNGFDSSYHSIYEVNHTSPNIQFFYKGTIDKWENQYKYLHNYVTICEKSLIESIYNKTAYSTAIFSIIPQLNNAMIKTVQDVIVSECNKTSDINKKLRILTFESNFNQYINQKQNDILCTER